MRYPRGLCVGSFVTLVAACSANTHGTSVAPPDAAASGPHDAGGDAAKDTTSDPAPARADAGSPDSGGRDARSGRDGGDAADATSQARRDSGLESSPGVVSGDAGGGGSPNAVARGCGAEPLRTTGTIHYVCDCQSGASSKCVAGSDNNAGTSATAPLQSFAKAIDAYGKLSAGDTVALCRGGRWSVKDGGNLANRNCSKDNTCDLRDYAPPWGDGSEGLPSIWVNGGSAGSTLMSFSHVSEHQEGFRVFNLDLHGGGSDVGFFFWNETTDTDLCNLSMDGFSGSVVMSGGDKPDYGTPSGIVLRGSRITNNTNIAYYATCDNCAIEDTFFDNNGVANATTHAVYFASQAWTVNGQNVVHEVDGMRLSRNEIHHSKIQCQGSPVVVHGRHKNVIIEDNLVDAANGATDGCWGPGVGCGGYPYGCWFRNTIVRRNIIRNLGNTGINNDQCTGCLVEDNLIIMNQSGDGVAFGGEAVRASSAYTEGDGQPDDPSNNMVVRNNTIYFASGATSGNGISVLSGTGHVLENNAIYYAVTKAGSSDNVCYQLPAKPAAALKMADYNICLIPGGADWMIAYGSAGMSLATWQGQSGFDKHSLMTDPMFTNAPNDFTPAAGSPLINAGDASNSPSVDLNGKTRDSQPDIGAIEK